jgi:hypothetical protein
MQHTDIESEGDPRYHLPPNTPIITPERAAKGDVFTGPNCSDCNTTGKDKITKLPCRTCKGRGWVGSINAATMESSDIRFAQVQVRNILNFLWNAGIITDDEHDDGHTFQAWRDQHRVALGLERPVSNTLEEPATLKLRAYGFILLLRKLNAYDAKAINKSLDVFANCGTEQDARREERPYRMAFTNLSKAIVPIKEKISYLERASDEERAALADEQLKMLLIAIKSAI